jgi:hypothetical protein
MRVNRCKKCKQKPYISLPLSIENRSKIHIRCGCVVTVELEDNSDLLETIEFWNDKNKSKDVR